MNDKLKHFLCCAIGTIIINHFLKDHPPFFSALLMLGVGAIKEAFDEAFGRTGFDIADMLANLAGCVSGFFIIVVML